MTSRDNMCSISQRYTMSTKNAPHLLHDHTKGGGGKGGDGKGKRKGGKSADDEAASDQRTKKSGQDRSIASHPSNLPPNESEDGSSRRKSEFVRTATEGVDHGDNSREVSTKEKKIASGKTGERNSNRMDDRSKLLLKSLGSFYSKRNNMDRVIPIIECRSPISLRLIDWTVTNYAFRHDVVLMRRAANNNIVHFHIWESYKAQLNAYSKNQFDPFRRRDRIEYYYEPDKSIETTLGQLNFFRWLLQNDVLCFISDNLRDIEEDMLETKTRLKKEQKRTKQPKPGQLLPSSSHHPDQFDRSDRSDRPASPSTSASSPSSPSSPPSSSSRLLGSKTDKNETETKQTRPIREKKSTTCSGSVTSSVTGVTSVKEKKDKNSSVQPRPSDSSSISRLNRTRTDIPSDVQDSGTKVNSSKRIKDGKDSKEGRRGSRITSLERKNAAISGGGAPVLSHFMGRNTVSFD